MTGMPGASGESPHFRAVLITPPSANNFREKHGRKFGNVACARSKHVLVAAHQHGSQAMHSKEPERPSCRTVPARGPRGHPDLCDHGRGSQQWAVLPQTAPGTPLLWLSAFHVGVESRCPDEVMQGQTRPCGGKELSSEGQSTHLAGAWPGRSLPGSTPARLTRTGDPLHIPPDTGLTCRCWRLSRLRRTIRRLRLEACGGLGGLCTHMSWAQVLSRGLLQEDGQLLRLAHGATGTRG